MRILFCAITLLGANRIGFAQNYGDKFSVTVNQEFTTIKAEVLKEEKKIEVDYQRTYLWYAYRKILQTKGGYDGRLLDGAYREFYLNDQLFTKGQIRLGLKNKEWRSWYPDGTLKEVIVWKNGVKHGNYELYNDYGKIMAKGRFRHDRLHARFYTYNMEGKVISRKRYKNGNEVLEKMKSEFDSNKEGIQKKKDKTEKREKGNWFKRLFKKKRNEIPQTTDFEVGPRLSINN